MGSFLKLGRYIKDFWKVVIKGENDDLQRQIRNMEEQLARVRQRKSVHDKQREAAALNEARMAVEKIRDLHSSFFAADAAVSNLAENLGKHAKAFLEAEMQLEEKDRAEILAKQRQIFQEGVRKTMEGNAGFLSPEVLAQLGERDGSPTRLEAHESMVEKVESLDQDGLISGVSKAAEVIDVEAASQDAEAQLPTRPEVDLKDPSSQALASSTRETAKKANASDIKQASSDPLAKRQGKKIKTVNASSSAKMASLEHTLISSLDKIVENTDVEKDEEMVSRDILAKIIEEDMKQTEAEHKVRIEALSKEREILQQELQAKVEAEAEHVDPSQGSK